jgi:acetyltransferase
VRALSEESRYFRFISTLSELTPRMLVRYTQVDYDRELALVAVVAPDGSLPDAGAQPQEERIVGVVRYLLNPDRESCEFAVAIADDWQGKRLGSTLMRAIVEAARSKGLKRIEGYVLASNSKMLGMMSHLGFTIETDREDPTMKIVWMALN